MTIKIGMTVRTTKACGVLTARGAEDLEEGAKGTVLSIDGETSLVALKSGSHVYVKTAYLAGCKGRPLKAESLARAIQEHQASSTASDSTAVESEDAAA